MTDALREEFERAKLVGLTSPRFTTGEVGALFAEIDRLRAAVRHESDCAEAYRAALAAPQAAGWRPIETAPKTGRKIIVTYVNRNNRRRTVMARWLTDEQAAETDGDGVGLEGGWYECIDNWDDYTEVKIYEGEPDHWQPLPAAPAPTEPQR